MSNKFLYLIIRDFFLPEVPGHPHIFYQVFNCYHTFIITMCYFKPPSNRINRHNGFYNWVFLISFPSYGVVTYYINTELITWCFFILISWNFPFFIDRFVHWHVSKNLTSFWTFFWDHTSANVGEYSLLLYPLYNEGCMYDTTELRFF